MKSFALSLGALALALGFSACQVAEKPSSEVSDPALPSSGVVADTLDAGAGISFTTVSLGARIGMGYLSSVGASRDLSTITGFGPDSTLVETSHSGNLTSYTLAATLSSARDSVHPGYTVTGSFSGTITQDSTTTASNPNGTIQGTWNADLKVTDQDSKVRPVVLALTFTQSGNNVTVFDGKATIEGKVYRYHGLPRYSALLFTSVSTAFQAVGAALQNTKAAFPANTQAQTQYPLVTGVLAQGLTLDSGWASLNTLPPTQNTPVGMTYALHETLTAFPADDGLSTATGNLDVVDGTGITGANCQGTISGSLTFAGPEANTVTFQSLKFNMGPGGAATPSGSLKIGDLTYSF